MIVVPQLQTFADFTAKCWPQLVVKHFSHTACGGRQHASTSTMMTWVHVRSAVLRLYFLGGSAAEMSVIGLTPMPPAKLQDWWGLLVRRGLVVPSMPPDTLKSACTCMAHFMLHCPADAALTVVLGPDRASSHFWDKAPLVQPVSPTGADGVNLWSDEEKTKRDGAW